MGKRYRLRNGPPRRRGTRLTRLRSPLMSNSDSERPTSSAPRVVSADETKQGRWGAPVFVILIASLALAVLAYIILHAVWFGADDEAQREMNSPPPAQERPQT